MMKYPDNLPSPMGLTKSEILDILLTEEYGFLPPAPLSVTAETESVDKSFCAGKALLTKIKLTANMENGEFSFPVYFTCPKAAQNSPLPCFIHINFRDNVPDKFLPAEEISDAGYAVLSFCYKDISSDDSDFQSGLSGVVYPNGRTKSTDCGKIGLWAWAAMRVMDYALTLPELKHDRISVIGHSRLGKTALLAGALDERFYCAISNNSGCSGAALARDTKGETVASICKSFPFWFCENYAKYSDNESIMPFDQHFLIAANAPHRVYVASAKEDFWADPENEYLSCCAASDYYKETGMSGFVHPDRLPEAGDVFSDGDIAYHLRDGGHYLSRTDWNNYINYLNR